MIFGIGCDLCEVGRIEKTAPRFLEKCFTQNERELFSKKRNWAQTVAANFAAKEAFSKAMGTGMMGLSFEDIEVLRDDMGKPYINVYNGAKEKLERAGVTNIFVSLSHTDSLAMAYVVLEKESL